MFSPSWTGDGSKFVINSGKLKLQAPVIAETAFLSLPSQAIHGGSWEFYLQMDFIPSSTNYARIYLISDNPDLNHPLKGYFIKAGNTSREVSLYRQNGSTETEIIDGLDDRINLPTVRIKIKVTRNETGEWQLFSDVGPTGSYTSEGLITDNNFTNSSYFGVNCFYTSTRSDKFWFDDFIVNGMPVPDTTPPAIQSTTAIHANQIDLLFSEPVESISSIQPANFLRNNEVPVSTLLSADSRTISLMYAMAMTNGVNYSIQVSNVKDLAGNTIASTKVNCLFFNPVSIHRKDIIFTELFRTHHLRLVYPMWSS